MLDPREKNDEAPVRRVLIVTDAAKAVFQPQLEAAGLVTLATTSARALLAISEFSPSVLIIEMAAADSARDERVALARQLRSTSATYTLPIVMVCDLCDENIRQVATSIGVDDCFARATPVSEVLARLDALFWRVAAGRRSPALLEGQRLEIDNFLLLLDSIREQIDRRQPGTVALLVVACASQPTSARRIERVKEEAFGFFKLNLRRLDEVAFYGPNALLICLPRLSSSAASSRLRELRAEFLSAHADVEVHMGLASFPADGTDVEKLLEKCDAAAARAPAEFPTDSDTSEHMELLVSGSEILSPPVRQTAQSDATATKIKELALEAAPKAAVRTGEASEDVRALRVLLAVSDAPRMARLNSLIRSAGYEVRAAFDGEQALSLLRIERPDLLLLESGLDKINGLEMIERLRQQGGGRILLPVLFLNSSGDDNAGREALALGARKVLTQPFEPGDVLAGMREAASV
ncbi:MAG: two-component system, OmpR family, operon response regulator KdpE [Blastocatellia bacterium]|jgi:PleD family two-component response regulator|nr:two-component system, OmpR family, operon response regulator KdpE [Blastocatellia bacterium]